MPFTYEFDAIDLCTNSVHGLVNPIPTANALTTQLRYDVGKPCARAGDRQVMVVGTVMDRLGASAELCNRQSKCPIVELSPVSDLDPRAMITAVKTRMINNSITSLKAVDQLIFAVQTIHHQINKHENRDHVQDGNGGLSDRTSEKVWGEQDVLSVLSMLVTAAQDTMRVVTLQTLRVRGWYRISYHVVDSC